LTINKSTDPCSETISYEGPLGCPTAKLDIEKYAALIAPYVGFIMIAAGLIMTFAGAKFIEYLGAFLVGLAVTGFTFGVGFNLLPPHHTKLFELILLLAFGILLGAVAAHFAWAFIKNGWAVSIMAGFAAVVLVLMLCGVADVQNFYVKIVSIVVGLIVGAYIGKKLQKIIKTFGTAFIGAFLTVRGASFFLGGWP